MKAVPSLSVMSRMMVAMMVRVKSVKTSFRERMGLLVTIPMRVTSISIALKTNAGERINSVRHAHRMKDVKETLNVSLTHAFSTLMLLKPAMVFTDYVKANIHASKTNWKTKNIAALRLPLGSIATITILFAKQDMSVTQASALSIPNRTNLAVSNICIAKTA
jgi:hypothetical protein